MDRGDVISRAHDYISRETADHFRKEVESLLAEEDYDELRDRFYTDLEFGTGGMRGAIGGGLNRMNPLNVGRATQGLADYLNATYPSGEKSVVIAYDSRHFSAAFALRAALVLCANGIVSRLYSGLRPTPQLSFSVRRAEAVAGIVITASHNPAEYNGYKVYWSDGGQIVPPHDSAIVRHVRAVTEVETMEEEEARSAGLLHMVDREFDEAYLDLVVGQTLRPDLVASRGPALKVVYTPLHGAGAVPLSSALRRLGIDVIMVEEQAQPDGAFPTVAMPNPEEPAAMQRALHLAEKTRADLVLGTDPDADRLGVAVPDGNGYTLLSGNRIGALLCDYIFSTRTEKRTLPAKPAFVKTIVTSELQRLIAEDYGATCFETLTGFKYIGEMIHRFESGDEGYEYVFGGEESYGYLVGTAVRDKDGISAAAMIAEAALYHASEGRSLLDRLEQLWKKFGYFEEVLISRYFKGEAGSRRMKAFTDALRKNPPDRFASLPVVNVKDYLEGTTYYPQRGEKKTGLPFPSSDVLQYILSDNTVVSIRPSGTEPKIKFYVSCRSERGATRAAADEVTRSKIAAVTKELDHLMETQVSECPPAAR